MEFTSILNDVIGPVMRGPSSSHTAGAYRIGSMARALLGEAPSTIRLTFDPTGSYAPTYIPLGVDIAFTVGVMGWSMVDEDYFRAVDRAREKGVEIDFRIGPLDHSNHPNAVWIEMESEDGKVLSAGAESIGGGIIRFTRLDGWVVHLTGKSHEILVEAEKQAESRVARLLSDKELIGDLVRRRRGDRVLLHARRRAPLDRGQRSRLKIMDGVTGLRLVEPLFYVQRGRELFSCAQEMVAAAEEGECSLGQIALAYESQLLGLAEEEILEEVMRRLDVMEKSVLGGLDDRRVDMLLLRPTAGRVLKSEREGRCAIGGIHTRAAARALAVMHVCNSRGVVCAAPTGGSAGVIPGVLVSLIEERRIPRQKAALALLAASAVGLILAKRATFAAEIAGCQVEIGAAGAMAAAAVVEAADGTARQAADAAAIALQNTMGSVCDTVQGACEIPCHTRNAVAASSAFVCADLIIGGYENPIPLDETIDASYAVGKVLPRELRCTSAGGLAVTPSAQAMPRLR